jgi:hypothetical protein
MIDNQISIIINSKTIFFNQNKIKWRKVMV